MSFIWPLGQYFKRVNTTTIVVQWVPNNENHAYINITYYDMDLLYDDEKWLSVDYKNNGTLIHVQEGGFYMLTMNYVAKSGKIGWVTERAVKMDGKSFVL